MSYAINEGIRIYYEIVGKGEPLILQHGFSQESGEWRRFGYVSPLSERYRVVLVDMRGHGQSDKPHDGKAYARKNLVGDIVTVLDALGIQRAHYWGYSMGGWIGLGLLTQAPQRLNKAILGGVHPYERKVPPYQSDGSDAEQFMRELGKRVGIDFDSLPAEFRKRLMAADCRALAVAQQDSESLEALLHGISTPCLMYAGDKDGLFAQAQKGAAAIPNCTFVAVPGAHVQSFQNAPAILPDAMKFLG
jgi:pimeloyl-ACP methyl ester carboxylesterase